MAGKKSLDSLIRLNRHELDEKRRVLSERYQALAQLARERAALDADFEREKKALAASGDIAFTFEPYARAVRERGLALDRQMAEAERNIEAAKQDLMVVFAELKKFEMSQEERRKLEEEERKLRETKIFDEIGLQMFRRQDGES